MNIVVGMLTRCWYAQVDVTSLEPLRLADKQLSTQLAELEKQLREQLATKEAVEQAVEPLATRDLLRR